MSVHHMEIPDLHDAQLLRVVFEPTRAEVVIDLGGIVTYRRTSPEREAFDVYALDGSITLAGVTRLSLTGVAADSEEARTVMDSDVFPKAELAELSGGGHVSSFTLTTRAGARLEVQCTYGSLELDFPSERYLERWEGPLRPEG